MSAGQWDVIFIGGGFAAGLAAYRLHLTRPDIRFLLIEPRASVIDDQTWSFQAVPQDADPSLSGVFADPRHSWIQPLLSGVWDRYEVHFPKIRRVIESSYFSIRSSHFQDYLRQQFPDSWLVGDEVVSWTDYGVQTKAGRQLSARCVIDSRGWVGEREHPCGYQKFLGLQVRTAQPHGISHPTIMDACLEQEDGFRFMYVLPWSRDELLIEDTHYSDTGDFDPLIYEAKIRAYAAQKGWEIAQILGRERGSLPIPYRGEPRPESESCLLGARAGLFHATTGYSVYEAVRAAEEISLLPQLDTTAVRQTIRDLSQRRWREQRFYRRLNNMLFHAIDASKRYQILESFYAHPQDLLARFYSGYTSRADKVRILSRKPPVPLLKGLYYFFHSFEATHGTSGN